MNREIIITCTAYKAFPNSSFAGYAGEHLATTLILALPDELKQTEYTYRLDFKTVNNSYTACIDSVLSFALPQALTIAGTLTVQLTISNETEVIYKTQPVKLTIKESINAVEEVDDKYVGLLNEKLEDFQAVLDKLGVLDVNELRGIAKIEKTATEGYTDTYTIYYSDKTTSIFTITNGANGKDGSNGKDGINGKDGANGKDGTDYVLTDDDKSAIAQLVYDNYISSLNQQLETRLNGGVVNG